MNDAAGDADHEHSEVAPTESMLPPQQLVFMQGQTVESWQGPMPPPDLLSGYKDVEPSFPDRMMTMTEQQIDSLIRLNDSQVRANDRLSQAGLHGTWLTYLIQALIVLVGGGLALTALLLGETGAGVTLGIFDLLVAVGWLAWRQRSRLHGIPVAAPPEKQPSGP